MIETVRKINNNRFPRDIAELEENVLDMAAGNLSAIPISLTLAELSCYITCHVISTLVSWNHLKQIGDLRKKRLSISGKYEG